MMNRLRDQPPDPALTEAKRLLDAMPPIEVTPALASRLRRRLEAAPRQRSSTRMLRLAVVVCILVAGTAFAATAVHRAIHHAAPQRVDAPAQTTNPTRTVAPPNVRPESVDAPEPAATESAPVSSAPAPVASEKPIQSRAPKSTSESGLDLDSPDAFLVISAIQALRQEGNPTKADGLLDQYLRLHPRGALSEEALALRIEAMARADDPKAARFADQYLTQFPHGRYAEAARRARVRFSE